MTGEEGRVAIRAHEPNYENPIAVRKGDVVVLSGRRLEWDGKKENVWFWATGPDGREGWVADDLAVEMDGIMVATYDYDSMELKVEPGDFLNVQTCKNGWCLCTNDTEETGWVPDRIFRLPDG